MVEVVIAVTVAAGQVLALGLSWKMIRFTGQYSKRWKNAFVTFFILMALCLLRRATVLCWVFDINGQIGYMIQWIDKMILTLGNTIFFNVFLIQLLTFWRKFFKEYIGLIGPMEGLKDEEGRWRKS